MIDVVISFRTSHFNSMTGDEIKDKTKIALNYIQGKFLIDVISALPFDDILAELNKKTKYKHIHGPK